MPNDSARVDTLFQKAMDAGISIEVKLPIFYEVFQSPIVKVKEASH